MKTFVSRHWLILSIALGASVSLHAQSGNAARTPPALGLLRLQTDAKANQGVPVAAAKITVDDLSAAGIVGVAKEQKNNVDYLTLDAGKVWSRPLRGSGREATFASFQVYGSQTTIIEIGGARLGLTAGPIAGSLQLMYDDGATGTLQWKALNVHVGTGKYGGKALAALPVLTVMLDPAAGLWHLYLGSRLLADQLPLVAARRDNRQFTVTAGTEGAWITGLVLSDDNPLYEDANANGIDDAFERQKRGATLPTTATLADRQQLATDWKAAQRAQPPPALAVNRPMPDGR